VRPPLTKLAVKLPASLLCRGGLVVATLVNARDHGLPLPTAALVMSLYVDLTLDGGSMETRRDFDPLLSRKALEARVSDYTSGETPVSA
jgi:acetyl esterase/lipase